MAPGYPHEATRMTAPDERQAGLRWIDALHEDANGLVWTTKAELRAALAVAQVPAPTIVSPNTARLGRDGGPFVALVPDQEPFHDLALGNRADQEALPAQKERLDVERLARVFSETTILGTILPRQARALAEAVAAEYRALGVEPSQPSEGEPG